MWSLKSNVLKRLTHQELEQSGEPIGRMLQLKLSLVFTNGNEAEEISIFTFISTKDEVKAAINQNLDRLNSQEELVAEVKAGTFTYSPEVAEVIPLTAEEIAKAQEEEFRAKLIQLKSDVEIKLITEVEYAAEVLKIQAEKKQQEVKIK